MATFVLVHGAWHGGWCWRDVATELRAAGHDVHVPTLSGCGEKARLAAHVDLSLHVEEFAGLLYFADLREVVLVGHSYGGLPVSGAAARFGARIARLVYLDAFVADDGQSLFDLLRPDRRKFYEESAADGPGPVTAAGGLRRGRAARMGRRPADAAAAADVHRAAVAGVASRRSRAPTSAAPRAR